MTRRDHARRISCAALLLATVSCVPAAGKPQSGIGTIAAEPSLRYDLSYLLADDLSLAVTSAPDGAVPFVLRADEAAAARALRCLTEAVYHEARSESVRGQRAVAQVVLNRARHPAWPSGICAVVYQGPLRAGGGCQFTFTCDGSLRRRGRDVAAWEQAQRVAQAALAGATEPSVGLATHYHTDEVRPAWGALLMPVTTIGSHVFYRLPGRSGKPSAFVLEPTAQPSQIPKPAAPSQIPKPPAASDEIRTTALASASPDSDAALSPGRDSAAAAPVRLHPPAYREAYAAVPAEPAPAP